MKLVLNKLVPLLVVVGIAQVHAAEMRDPTRPSGFQASSSDSDELNVPSNGVQLQAIFFHPDYPAALINGRRFSVGDNLGDAQISAIHTDKIILTDVSGEKEVRLISSSIKSRMDSGQNPAVQEIQK